MRGMSVASRPTPMIFTLPKPNGAFRWVQLPARPFDDAQGRPALVCDPLAPFAPHFFTTRTWTLGAPSPGAAAWMEIAAAAGVELSRLCRLRQVHGAEAVVRRRAAGDADRGSGGIDGARLGRAGILITDHHSLA